MSALELPRRVLRRVSSVTERPRLVVVPPPARHPLLLTVASLLVVATAVFGAVTFNALAADEAVRARALEDRLRVAESTYGELLAEVAALESPARIATAASELGLQRVEHPRQLHVRRVLPADGAADETPSPGDRTDRLKPLLADG